MATSFRGYLQQQRVTPVGGGGGTPHPPPMDAGSLQRLVQAAREALARQAVLAQIAEAGRAAAPVAQTATTPTPTGSLVAAAGGDLGRNPSPTTPHGSGPGGVHQPPTSPSPTTPQGNPTGSPSPTTPQGSPSPATPQAPHLPVASTPIPHLPQPPMSTTPQAPTHIPGIDLSWLPGGVPPGRGLPTPTTPQAAGPALPPRWAPTRMEPSRAAGIDLYRLAAAGLLPTAGQGIGSRGAPLYFQSGTTASIDPIEGPPAPPFGVGTGGPSHGDLQTMIAAVQRRRYQAAHPTAGPDEPAPPDHAQLQAMIDEARHQEALRADQALPHSGGGVDSGSGPLPDNGSGDPLGDVASGWAVIGGALVDLGRSVISDITHPIRTAKEVNEALPGAISEGVAPFEAGLKRDWNDLPPDMQIMLRKGYGFVVDAISYPQNHLGKPAFGYVLYQMAENPAATLALLAAAAAAGDPGAFAMLHFYAIVLTPERRQQIIDTFNSGGAMAVWETDIAGAANGIKDDGLVGLIGYTLWQFAINTASDPLALLPALGEGLRVFAAGEEVAAANRGLEGTTTLGKIAEGTATGVEVMDRVVNAPGWLVGEGSSRVFQALKSETARVFDSPMYFGGGGAAADETLHTMANDITRRSAKFKAVAGETPIYVSTHDSYVVTLGPDGKYRVRTRDGYALDVETTPAAARKYAEDAAALGLPVPYPEVPAESSSTLATGGPVTVGGPGTGMSTPAAGSGDGSDIGGPTPALFQDASTGLWVVREGRIEWRFTTQDEANRFRSALDEKLGTAPVTLPENGGGSRSYAPGSQPSTLPDNTPVNTGSGATGTSALDGTQTGITDQSGAASAGNGTSGASVTDTGASDMGGGMPNAGGGTSATNPNAPGFAGGGGGSIDGGGGGFGGYPDGAGATAAPTAGTAAKGTPVAGDGTPAANGTPDTGTAMPVGGLLFSDAGAGYSDLPVARLTAGMSPGVLHGLPEAAVVRDAGGRLPEGLAVADWGRWAGASAAAGGSADVGRAARDLGKALEAGRRISVFVDGFAGELGAGLRRFDGLLAARAAKRGVDPRVWQAGIAQAARGRAANSGVFSAEDVRAATGDEALARAWRSEVNRATRAAQGAVSTRSGSGGNGLSGALAASYAAARTSGSHAGATLGNPFLTATFERAWLSVGRLAAGTRDAAGLRGLAAFMGSDAGLRGLTDPAGVVVPIAMYEAVDAARGGWPKRAEALVHPLVEGGLAALGEDPAAAARIRGAAGLVARGMAAQGIRLPGLGADGSVTAEFLDGVVAKITAAVGGDGRRGPSLPTPLPTAPWTGGLPAGTPIPRAGGRGAGPILFPQPMPGVPGGWAPGSPQLLPHQPPFPSPVPVIPMPGASPHPQPLPRSGRGGQAAHGGATAERLVREAAGHRVERQVVEGLLGALGMGSGLSGGNPYVQPWLRAVLGETPRPTPLMEAFRVWAQGLPPGADGSPAAFGAQYDRLPAGVRGRLGGEAASTPSRLMALYSAWVTAQGPGADGTPEGFGRYVAGLGRAAA